MSDCANNNTLEELWHQQENPPVWDASSLELSTYEGIARKECFASNSIRITRTSIHLPLYSFFLPLKPDHRFLGGVV